MRSSVKQIKSQWKNTNWAAPFGYIKDPKDKYHIIIDEKVAFIVKEAFDLILKGYSCTQVANIFNKKEYVTRSERKEISILNVNLQTIYENYKKKNVSKEEYLMEKTLIQDKKVLLENKLEEVKSHNIDSKKEFDGNSLDENNLLKAYVDSSIDKIIESRTGEIEIIEV